MAVQTTGQVTPTNDQPRVSQKSLRYDSGPSSLQYKVQGIRTSSNRNPSTRDYSRK